MKCPRDQAELAQKGGVIEVLTCPECGGLFIKNASIKKHIDALLEKDPGGLPNPPEYLQSPFDGKAMIPIKIKGVTVDYCKTSGYVWFDKGEFEQLKKGNSDPRDGIVDGCIDAGSDIFDFVSWDLSIVGDVFSAVGDGISEGFGKIGDLISFDF